ncbi:MAG: YcgN family cysteine cluster protein [Rhodospirillales bacterium]|nr:YcgN family cysteine cluster protein [Rhodospirillales bacterium]
MNTFWTQRPMDRMSHEEWESLCDGCGKCCLNKLEDADTGDVFFTDVACRLLDTHSCRCTDYENREKTVPDCVGLSAEVIDCISWLPSTCAYRLVREGKALPQWHHLVCGDRDAIHRAGWSVRGRVVSERENPDLEDHVVHWPE